MKKLFFIAALLMAAETVIPSDNNPKPGETWGEWLSRKKKEAKAHLGRHWRTYAAGTAVVGLSTAAYLNRDKIGAYLGGRSRKDESAAIRRLDSYFDKKLTKQNKKDEKIKKTKQINDVYSIKPTFGEATKAWLQGNPIQDNWKGRKKYYRKYKKREKDFFENQKKMRENNKQYTYSAGKERQRQRIEDIKSGKNLNPSDEGSDYLLKNRQKRKYFFLKNMTPEEKESYGQYYESVQDPYVPSSPRAFWHDIKTFFRVQPRN